MSMDLQICDSFMDSSNYIFVYPFFCECWEQPGHSGCLVWPLCAEGWLAAGHFLGLHSQRRSRQRLMLCLGVCRYLSVCECVCVGECVCGVVCTLAHFLAFVFAFVLFWEGECPPDTHTNPTETHSTTRSENRTPQVVGNCLGGTGMGGDLSWVILPALGIEHWACANGQFCP